MNTVRPKLQKRIFWDVDFDKINYEENWEFVITRVFERGDVEDIREVRRFYGDDKVITALTTAKWLFYHTFSWVKNMFGLKKTDFKCYMLNQSKRIPWTY